MELSVGLVPGSLVSRASVAGIHVFVDHLSHAGPVEVSSDELQCLFLSKMASRSRIVV